MDPLLAHQRAQDAFAAVLAKTTPDQRDKPSPCTEWTAKGVIDHVIGGNQWVQQLAGREPAATANADDLVEAHATGAAGAQAVFAAPDGLSRVFTLPFGDMPGSVFISLRTGDLLAHAWDLAKSTGQPTDIDPEVATYVLGTGRQLLRPEFRGPGKPFAEEQKCPDGASAADAFAAFTGRAV
jgi:uncharacterized protein (TIGR03086 family)